MSAARIVATLGAVLVAAVLTGCADDTTAAQGASTADPATSVLDTTPAGFNADDMAFATNMIPHHQQAVELSALVPDRTTNADLIALAQQISAAQQPEIDIMKAFLVQWKENPQDDTGHAGGHTDMAGMVDDATMAKLETLNGPEFDTLWLQSMIAHHQGAVEMAKAEIANGQNVDAKSLAQSIVTAQQAEITQMRKMLVP